MQHKLLKATVKYSDTISYEVLFVLTPYSYGSDIDGNRGIRRDCIEYFDILHIYQDSQEILPSKLLHDELTQYTEHNQDRILSNAKEL